MTSNSRAASRCDEHRAAMTAALAHNAKEASRWPVRSRASRASLIAKTAVRAGLNRRARTASAAARGMGAVRAPALRRLAAALADDPHRKRVLLARHQHRLGGAAPVCARSGGLATPRPEASRRGSERGDGRRARPGADAVDGAVSQPHDAARRRRHAPAGCHSASPRTGAHPIGRGERRAAAAAVRRRFRRGAHCQLLDRRLLPSPIRTGRPCTSRCSATPAISRLSSSRTSPTPSAISTAGIQFLRWARSHAPPTVEWADILAQDFVANRETRADLGDRRQRVHGDELGAAAPAGADVSRRPRAFSGASEFERRFLFISKPVIGRASGKWSVQFSRKLTDSRRAVRRRRRHFPRRRAPGSQLWRTGSRARAAASRSLAMTASCARDQGCSPI